MRLLKQKSDGQFNLMEFFEDDIPPYAILSHTWGADGEEVTFQDLIKSTGNNKAGYDKIRFCGKQANIDSLQYFWIDTYCIDKSSSSELTEAINSMFRWYRDAVKCYVYLSDVSIYNDDESYHFQQVDFQRSRWFTRGWTLQELIAPPYLEFYSSEGKRIGDKRLIEQQISQITGIPFQALRGEPLANFTVAERFSWAVKRDTKRKEDRAYCLLGIFDVSMPLIYGEGERALTRLRDEIKRYSESISRLMNPDVGPSIMASSHLERRLSEIQQSILETHNVVMSEKHGIGHTLHSYPSNPRGQVGLIEPLSWLPWRTRVGSFTSAIHDTSSQTHGDYVSTERSKNWVKTDTRSRKRMRDLEVNSKSEHEGGNQELDRQVKFARVSSTSMALPRPTSPFETWFPEQYTLDQRLPISSLIVTSSYQRSFSDQFRTRSFRILYLKSPRNWRRLNISITVYCSSVYWAVTQLLPQEYAIKDGNTLAATAIPHSLLLQVQQLLLKAQGIDDDAHLHFSLTNKDLRQEYFREPQKWTQSTTTESKNSSREIITYLDDLRCPRYSERQLIQVAIIEWPSHFASLLNGSLVFETKFARPIPSSEYLYNIELYRCMDSIPGFLKLFGIVVDKSATRLKSYIVEFPRTKWSPLADNLVPRKSIPWSRRESWARQLVELVRQIHAKGFVVGTLCHMPVGTPILIDALDRLYLWHFRSNFVLGYSLGCYYPPEFRQLRRLSNTTSELDSPKVTLKTDIFQLGMVLWYIAEGISQSACGPICMREGCNMGCVEESHIDPVGLPSLPKDIPHYYQKVVNDCRVEDPNKRPAAWKILDQFPPTSQSECSLIETQDAGNADLESLSKACFQMVFCDICRGKVGESFFHCNICSESDFDICVACYDKGSHCMSKDHLLVKVEKESMGNYTISRNYHSSVDPLSGTRRIVEL